MLAWSISKYKPYDGLLIRGLLFCYNESVRLNEHVALKEFLERSRAITIAVPIDAAGTIHAASLQYWFTAKPPEFYFVTFRGSEKCRLLKPKLSLPCAAVVGTEIGVIFTVQMRGSVRIVEPSENEEQVAAYYKKRGDRALDLDDPAMCLLKFTPNWIRYKDYSQGYDSHFIDVE